MGIPTERITATLRPNALPVHDRGAGVRSIYLVTSNVGSRAMMTGLTLVKPGSSVPLHYHNCEETILVLEGEALVDLGGEVERLSPRDSTWVAAGVAHGLTNPGQRELTFVWMYPTIEPTRTIVSTGRTTRIAAGRDRVS
jgi:putative monooxygenase